MTGQITGVVIKKQMPNVMLTQLAIFIHIREYKQADKINTLKFQPI